MKDLSNTQLGQYQLVEQIGHGGMAAVYKAYQPALDRYVAVKVLRPDGDPQFTARFQREAQIIARLQHPNILPIYDYGEQDGQPYFVAQYVEGCTTLCAYAGRPTGEAVALQLIGQVLSALSYAHSQGIVHRDIKPANILLPKPGWPMLADFGIAKLLHESQRLTMTGFIIGTAAYMSPEQASSQPLDGRTDLYAIGVVLYELLTGRLPFDADTPMAMLSKHVYEAPPSPRSINPAMHPAVEQVLLRAIEKDPALRFQTAADMAAALEQAIAALSAAAMPAQATQMYQAGLAAFQAGRWDEAVGQLSSLARLDPQYEDVTSLLEAARQAQAAGLPSALPDAGLASQGHTYTTRMLGGATAWQHSSPTAVSAPRSAASSQLAADALRSGAAAQPRGRWLLAAIVVLLLAAMGGAWWRRSQPAYADSPVTTSTAISAPTPVQAPRPAATPTALPAPPPAAPAAAPQPPAQKPPAQKPPKPPKPTKPKKGK